MLDPRERFIQQMELALINKIEEGDINTVINTLIIVADNYEIQDRCTELMVLDDSNDKLIKLYAGCCMVDGKSKSTIGAYIYELGRMSRTLEKPFTEYTPLDIRKYLALKLNAGLKKTTVENCRAYICAFFTWLEMEEYVDKSPCRKIKPIKCDKEQEAPFSDTDIATIRDHIRGTRNRAIMEFLLATGVRAAELCSLERGDIDFTSLAVHIRNGKGGKSRITCMTPVCSKYLTLYLTTRDDNLPYLFITERGRAQLTTEALRVILNKVSQESGIGNMHPHRFRHTFATNCTRSGMKMEEVQLLLGHSSIETTRIYVTTSQEQVRNRYLQTM